MDRPVLLAFNRGIISKLALARVDLQRTALSAEIQTNYMPRTLGSMMLRPGTEYIGASDDNNKAKYIPFVFANDDTAKIEVTDSKIRVWVDDELVTRASVSASVTNGAFTSDVTNWTDSDESGATSAFVTGGYLGLTGNGTAAAIRDQQVTVTETGTRHALDIVIERGPVVLRVGSSAGDDDYISETTLKTGVHSLAFTPTGNFHIRLQSRLERQVLVDSVAVASSGIMELAAPWAEADLPSLRWDQSADVIFVGCDGYQQRRIERRATDSWSLVLYQSEDGPYRIENTGPTTISANAITGNATLTASNDLFQSTHVGSLFRLTSAGQRVEADVSAENNFTDAIQVSGVGSTRQFNIEIAGTWTATVTLQRSIGEEGNWEDVSGQTWTANTTTSYNDGLDNQIVFYRIGVKTGDFTSDTVELALDYAIGSITGVVRITAVASGTSASAEVLRDLGGTAATDTWAEGSWSDYRGWPSAVAIYEGRLWWAGKGNIYASVSDAFENFDPDTEGDSAPMNRSIGSGPVDTIFWLLGGDRLLVGAGGKVFSVRSSTLDEIVTATNFNLKPVTTQGAANVLPVIADHRGIFVQASGTRVFELAKQEGFEYTAGELTALAPEIGEPSVVALAVQRQPDTRIHCVRSDGTVAVLVTDPAEEVRCWIPVETDGFVEDVVVLPGDIEDTVCYSVKRTIGGSTKRYLEKWAMESEARAATITYDGDSTTSVTDLPFADGTIVTVRDSSGDKIENLTVSAKAITLSSAQTYVTITPAVVKVADSHVTFNRTASAVVTGLSYLEGKSVVVWADGKCLEDENGDIAIFTVSGGSITMTDGGASYSAEAGCVGLAYRARFKSSKLAYAAPFGTALEQRKRVSRIGLILADTHAQGVKYGQSFDVMDGMPLVVKEADVDQDYCWESYDDDDFSFPGEWDTDSRLCLESNAPRPCTVLAVPFLIETHPKA